MFGCESAFDQNGALARDHGFAVLVDHLTIQEHQFTTQFWFGLHAHHRPTHGDRVTCHDRRQKLETELEAERVVSLRVMRGDHAGQGRDRVCARGDQIGKAEAFCRLEVVMGGVQVAQSQGVSADQPSGEGVRLLEAFPNLYEGC